MSTAWRTPIRYGPLGDGRYAVSAGPITVQPHPVAGRAPNEQQVPPDSVLLLDPCGPVLTRLAPTHLEPAPVPETAEHR